MAPRAKRPSAKSRTKRGSKPKARKKPDVKPSAAAESCGREADRYVRDLLVRGEAVKPSRRGKLPPGATHVIEKVSRDGTAEVKRVRFKLV